MYSDLCGRITSLLANYFQLIFRSLYGICSNEFNLFGSYCARYVYSRVYRRVSYSHQRTHYFRNGLRCQSEHIWPRIATQVHRYHTIIIALKFENWLIIWFYCQSHNFLCDKNHFAVWNSSYAVNKWSVGIIIHGMAKHFLLIGFCIWALGHFMAVFRQQFTRRL